MRSSVLRRCYETGDFEPLRDWYAGDAVCDALAGGRRTRVVGADRILAQLAAWWPQGGDIIRWQVDEFASGWTVELERTLDGGSRRQRQFLQLDGGRVVRQQVYSARPQGALGAPPPSAAAERLLRGFGEVAEREPLTHPGQAGGWLERVRLADGRRLVLKRVLPDRNFQSRNSGVSALEARLWEAKIMQRLPPGVDCAVLAAARDDDEAVLVMRDVSEALLGASGRLSRDQSRRLLEALAAIHRTFAGEQHACLPALESYLTMTSPASLAEVVVGDDYIPKVMSVGWEVFAQAAPADVAETVFAHHADPAPLADALRRCGTGVAHGDFRTANLALEPAHVVALDWGLATQAPGVIDLAWYVFINGGRIDAPREALIADYRAAAGDLYDDRAITLGQLGALQWFGGLLAHELIESDAAKRERARRELAWWCERARAASALV